jgi:formylglycine-generating enzyme required for sulfatase activity
MREFAVRGNDYASSARTVRSANRRFEPPKSNAYSRGFRIAHTILNEK